MGIEGEGLKEVGLKRELGLWKTTLTGVGVILGAGIYALIGKAAGFAGNATWLSFIIAALVAGFTGLSYAELSSTFPKAGAEYEYTKKAFGRRFSFLVGWLIFIAGITAGSAVSLGFAGYFASIFGTPLILTAVALILVLSAVIMYGIKQSAWLAVVFTLAETFGLLLIIFIGLPYFGTVNYLNIPDLSGLFGAAALIFFAYIGFEGVTRLAEETKEPKKTIPRAVILSLVITTVLYALVALAAVSIMDWQALAASGAPLADVAGTVLGTNASLLLAIIALFSTANTVLMFLLSTSRVTYGMGKSRAFPSVFGKVHTKTRTPWFAILILMVLAVVFSLPGNIEFAADLTNFAVFATFMAVNAALIKLRYSNHDHRAFRVPLNIGKFPVLGLVGFLSSGFLLLNLGLEALSYGAGLIVLGLAVHYIWRKTKSIS